MDQLLFTDKPLILVAPLDWGLGHATRCIPIIKQLLIQNCSVLLAGEAKVEAVLRTEFPFLPFLFLKGYRIRYKKTKIGLLATIFLQIPKILRSIREEHQWLEKAVREQRIDAVISDNRYGLYLKSLPSVFITHQLGIKTPFGPIGDAVLQRINYRYINNFNQCWVPDVQQGLSLGGALSHPPTLPKIPVHYVGALTRFSFRAGEQHQHLLILLSGPEPQRTVLEQILLVQLHHYGQPVLFIRGLPGTTTLPKVGRGVRIVNHLPAKELEEETDKAAWVISRSGYSTVMDLMVKGKKSILIPTPGQTEQEYLGKYLMEKGLALCIKQSQFRLEAALTRAASFSYKPYSAAPGTGSLREVLENFIRQAMVVKTSL